MIFQIARVSEVPDTCIPYLQEAIDRPPQSMQTIETIKNQLNDDGRLYLILSGDEIYGIMFVLLSYNPRTGKDVFSPILIGGKYMELWKDSLWDFILEETLTCEFLLMGREAWGKVFPKLKRIGAIYTL